MFLQGNITVKIYIISFRNLKADGHKKIFTEQII